MASFLFFGEVLDLVSYLILAATSIYAAWEVLSLRRLRKNYSSLKHKFGILRALVLIIIFSDAKQVVDRVEKHVLAAKTGEAIVLRRSALEDCTMLAVAVCPDIPPNRDRRPS